LVLAGVVCIVGGLVCEAILEAAKANRAPPTFFTHVVGFLALFGLALMAGRDTSRTRTDLLSLYANCVLHDAVAAPNHGPMWPS